MWSYWTELVFSSHYSNRKAAGHCSMVRLKEECLPHRTDCPLGGKPGGSTRTEEKLLLDTACRLHGKVLDMPSDSYWGWLSCFSRTTQFISFLSKIGITSRSLNVASNRLQTAAQYASNWIWSKAKVLCMKEINAEQPCQCDYVRNGYFKCVITLTAESKRVCLFVCLFVINYKLHTKNED